MSKVLTCSEVWGGGAAIDTDFAMPGIDGALFSHPADGANGGDIYLISSCDMGQVYKLVVADVAGHGEPVARVGRLLGDLLRDNITERDNDRFLDQLNQQFQSSEPGGVVFATLACGTYVARKQEFCFAYAGHPHIILGREGRFAPLDVVANAADRATSNMPIGITRDANFRQGSVKLQVGDWLIFCTDGVLEACNGQGQEYGLARLLRDLTGMAVGSPSSSAKNRPVRPSPMVLKNGLLTRLRNFIAPRRLDQDDVTIIILTLRDLPDRPIVHMVPELEKLMRHQSPK